MTRIRTALREAVVYQYVFLAAALDATGGRKRPPDAYALDYLRQVLGWQNTWLHLSSADGNPGPSLSLPDDADAEGWLYPPDGKVDWVAAPGLKRAGVTVARLTGGAILLQQGVGQPEDATPSVWDELHNGLWAPDGLRQEPHFLGRTVCYGGRVADEEEARRLAEEVLNAPGTGQPVPARCILLPFGGWLFDRPGLRDTLALFYHDEDEAERAAATYFNDVLPAVLLHVYKVAHEYEHQYEGILRKVLERRERSLARVVHEARTLSNDLKRLEEQLKALAGAYGEFASALADFRRLQQSVGVNAANLEAVFVAHALPRSGSLAGCLARVTKAARQMEADERLYRAATDEAEVTLRAMQVQAELERAEAERAENELTEQRNSLISSASLIATILGTFLGVSNLISDDTAKAIIGQLVDGPTQLTVGAARVVLTVILGIVFCVPLIIYWHRSRKKTTKPSAARRDR